MMIRRRRNSDDRTSQRRDGATIVEMAVVLPVFFLLIFAFIEFGHVFMAIHVLNGAAKQAARVGIADNSTTQKVKDKANAIVTAMLGPGHTVNIKVLDGSVFDDPTVDPSTVQYSSLQEVDLSTAEPRQLFIVRCTLPYNDIAILGPKWVKNLDIVGQSVLRHE